MTCAGSSRHVALLWVALGATSVCCLACDRTCASTQQLADAADAATPNSAARAHPTCPDGMVRLPSFCIDRYEAHLATVDAPDIPVSPFERPRPGVRYVARSKPGVLPQAYVSRHEAESACRNAGKRLCRAAEWHRACSGPEEFSFPYGNERQAERCNTHKPHALSKVFGASTTFTYELHYNNPRVNQESGFLARTGEYQGCQTAEGVFDMVGNVHEWVADSTSGSLSKRIPVQYSKHVLGARGNGIFMGGYFSSRGEHGRGCAYVTTHHGPDYHDYSTGFRCCADSATER